MTAQATLDLFAPPSPREERWRAFHERHPQVYDELVRLARTYRRHRPKCSIRLLYHRLRWELVIQGLPDEDEAFKLNDHYTPFYAREIMRREPDLAGFFELRTSAADR